MSQDSNSIQQQGLGHATATINHQPSTSTVSYDQDRSYLNMPTATAGPSGTQKHVSDTVSYQQGYSPFTPLSPFIPIQDNDIDFFDECYLNMYD